MKKLILITLLGIAFLYWYGWNMCPSKLATQQLLRNASYVAFHPMVCDLPFMRRTYK